MSGQLHKISTNAFIRVLDRAQRAFVMSRVASALAERRWPVAGSKDTELGVLMEPEVGHGTKEVYAGDRLLCHAAA
jgi:hypothetical protein